MKKYFRNCLCFTFRKSPWRVCTLALLLLACSEVVTAQKPVSPVLKTGPAIPAAAPFSAQTAGGSTLVSTGPALLKSVRTSHENDALVVSLSLTRAVENKHFMMKDPPRLIIDLLNVDNRVSAREIPVNEKKVMQVRVSQFQDIGDKVTRLVFDLKETRAKHDIVAEENGLKVIFPDEKGTPSEVSPVQTAEAKAPLDKPADKASVKPAPEKPTPVKLAAGKPADKQPVTPASEKPATVKPAPEKPTPVKLAAEKPADKQPVTPASEKPATVKPAPEKPTPVKLATEKPAPEKPQAKPVSDKVVLPDRRPVMVAEIPSPAATRLATPTAKPNGETHADNLRSVGPASAATTPPPAIPVQAPSAAQAQEAPAQAAGRFSGTPLTLDLVDIPLVDFFRLMAEEGGINIVMDPGIKGNISIKVVKVPWDQIFEAALSNNGLDKLVEGNLVRIALKMTLQDEAKQRESLKKATILASDVDTKVKRLNYAKAATIVPSLVDQKSVKGTVVIDERTNSLILTDIPAYLQKMIGVIEILDIAQPQVEIEARIVSATRDFARDIGVQFGFVQGNLQRVTVGGPNTFGTIGGTRPSATPNSAFAAGSSITGRGASEAKSTQSAGVSTGTASQNAGNLNVNLPAGKAFGGVGISVGNIFDTFLLDAAITAGENKGLAKLISQPKTIAQNNAPAMITQGLRFPVQIIANNTITVQFQNAALTLTVTPQITYEGNILLDLQVENNTPDFSRQVNGIPSIRTSESKTRVLVTDGGTTVIGGILIDNETNNEDRVPGLASLPLIGNVFRRTSVAHSTQEVLFFITPKVVK